MFDFCIKFSRIEKQVSNMNVCIPSTLLLKSISRSAAKHFIFFDDLSSQMSLELFTNSSGFSVISISSSEVTFRTGIIISRNISKLISIKNGLCSPASLVKQLIILMDDLIISLMLPFCYKCS